MTTSDQGSVEPLLDDPDIVAFELARGGTAADLTRRLVRLRVAYCTLVELADETCDLCLSNTWPRLEALYGDIERAITETRAALGTVPSDLAGEMTAQPEAEG